MDKLRKRKQFFSLFNLTNFSCFPDMNGRKLITQVHLCKPEAYCKVSDIMYFYMIRFPSQNDVYKEVAY